MPENPRPSLDGFRRRSSGNSAAQRKPDLRPDHDLPAPPPQPLLDEPHLAKLEPVSETGGLGQKERRSWRFWLLAGMISLVAVCAVALVSGYAWYQGQLRPVTDDTSKHVRLEIVPGTTPDAIAEQLQDADVIRSSVAFRIYTKLTSTEHKLQAGAYSLQPSLSTPAIVDHLTSGKQDTFRVTFLPGDTLANNRQRLIDAGFSASEVDTALSKHYDRPLFAGKPASADLEGYIFGETYEFFADADVETILNRTFDEFEAFIEENDLQTAYKKRDLTLYEGITLASIIQKEVHGEKDSRQVAQVFLKRLGIGMPLGADATFVYAAEKAGVQPSVGFDSPYNTRIHGGLPPGPISVPGVHALLAVAHPASGDYLYFVSGDDGKTYFSRTADEHDANVQQHCRKNCALF